MKTNRKALNRISKQIIKHYLNDSPIESIAKCLNVTHEYISNVIEIFNDLTGPDLENLCKEIGVKEDSLKRNESEVESAEMDKSASGKRNKKASNPKQVQLKRIRLDASSNSTRSIQHSAFIKELSLLTNLYRYLAKSQNTRPFLLYRSLSYLRRPQNQEKSKSLPKILEKLRKDSLRSRRSSGVVEITREWPKEVEINFEGIFESPKESDWATVQANCEILCRFSYCWRQKGYANDSVIKLNPEPISVQCNPSSNQVSKDSIKFNLDDLLTEARSAGNGRIRSAHLEIHLEASEKKKNNSGPEKTNYKVQYVTAPLPLFMETPQSFGDVSVSKEPFLLTPGSYELRLGLDTDDYLNEHDIISDDSTKRLQKASKVNSISINGAGSGRIDWIASLTGIRQSLAIDEYERWPTLHFCVKWEKHPPPPPVESMDTRRTSRNKSTSSTNSTPPKSAKRRSSNNSQTVLKETSNSLLVTYKFLFEGNCQQWAESKDLICPWCRFNLRTCNISEAQGFLYHLRAFHPRFQFKASLNINKSLLNIEVTFKRNEDCNNDCGLRRWSPLDSVVCSRRDTDGRVIGGWDGLGNISSQVYDGSGPPRPQNSVTVINASIQDSFGFIPSTLGEGVNSTVYSLSRAYSRVRKPLKRIPFSELIYFKKFDPIFKGDINEPTISIRHLGTGHDRTYYHTWNCQPIRACEFDYDSENEEEVSYWLKANYLRNIEEFTDVNRGEKYMFEFWNDFLLSIPTNQLVMADGQMNRVVLLFIDHCYREVDRLDLRYNLITHLTNLIDYGLLSNTMLLVCLLRFDEKCAASRTPVPMLSP